MVPITMEAEVSYEVTIISLPTYKQQKLVQNATGTSDINYVAMVAYGFCVLLAFKFQNLYALRRNSLNRTHLRFLT